MKPLSLRVATSLIALVSGQSVLADVSPEEVWQKWRDLYVSTGSTVTAASTARDGDTLVVSGLILSSATDGATFEASIDEVRLRDLGDGTVEITASETMQFSTNMPSVDGAEEVALTGSASLPGMQAIASATIDATAYVFTLPSVKVETNTTQGSNAPSTVTLTLSDATSTYKLSGPEDAVTLDGTFASATLGVAIDTHDGAGKAKGSLSLADLTGKISGNFAGSEEENTSAALAKGFALETALGYGAINVDFDFVEPDGSSKIVGGSEGGSMMFAMDAARMRLTSNGKNASFTVSGGELPFPEVTLSYAETAFDFLVPLEKSDAPSDFTALTKIVDLAVSEEVWGLIDPTGALPHEPATLVIDTSGKTRVTADFMDETVYEALGSASPFELQTLDVTELRAKFAGADLTGKGSFIFDNTDLETFAGMPAPTGKMDLSLTGGNGLMDKLVAMGLISDEDAMSARMMLSMFANPGAGEDTLTSTLEFKDKHFYANGAQLQ